MATFRKPTRVWRGNDRAILTSMQKLFYRVQNRDSRAVDQANAAGIDPVMFAQNETDPVYLAMLTLIDRIGVCLAAKG